MKNAPCEVTSLVHHQRMLEAWSHKRFQLEYVSETFFMFVLPTGWCKKGVALSVGSGVGTRVAALRWLGIEAYGLDANEEIVAMTVKKAQGFNYHGNLLDSKALEKFKPFYCFSDDVLEHLTETEIGHFLKLTQALGIGEMIHSITTLEHTTDIDNDPTHVTKLKASEWRELLSREGWKVMGNSKKFGRFGVFHLKPASL